MLVDSKMLSFYVCLFVNSLDSTSSFCGNGRKIASQTTECQTGKPIALCMILFYTHTYFFTFLIMDKYIPYFKPNVSRELNVIPNKKTSIFPAKRQGNLIHERIHDYSYSGNRFLVDTFCSVMTLRLGVSTCKYF